MLTFKDLSLRRGSRLLLDKSNLTVHPGQRVGMIGANGVGKSSLFALIRQKIQLDEGEMGLPKEWVIASVAQETPALTTAALEYVMDGDLELRRTQVAIAKAEAVDDGSKLAHLHGHLEAIGGYEAPVRAARLLHGLGFNNAQEQLAVDTFSGGWRMRLNLAQALMCRSDLLLLDEPTNHLDLDAVLWLEEWLLSYQGTLLLISHDRDFLDRVVNHIVHLEQAQLVLYRGNYSAFERLRAEKLAQQQASFERQQRERAHMQSFVERFRAKASKAKQAQSRLKALGRLEEISAAHVDSPFHFQFRPAQNIPHPLLSLDRVSVGYADKPILNQVSFSLLPGARIGLLGPNGAGKSTLIKLLAGELEGLSGDLQRAKTLRIGYFAQHQLEQLNGNDTPLEHLQALDRTASESELRDYLGGFGFVGDQAIQVVAPFSGGEKARLVLALLVYQRPNLLLLDEPTNHLDMEMRHALSLALQGFEGVMIVVSHDRHLLRSVCDELWLVAEGKLNPFADALEEYPKWLAEQRKRQTELQSGQKVGADDRKIRRQQQAEKRKQLQPLRNKLKKAEQVLDKLQDENSALETLLADPAVYEASAKAELKTRLAEQASLSQALEQAEELWLGISEELELLEAG
ncbi:MAG: ATP-binding cassette domain-containing protein [Gammaproteobacteria bacterium]|nr:ATP-binding cassette domain-containing protein [Gammaproteobacteria bacterium]